MRAATHRLAVWLIPLAVVLGASVSIPAQDVCDGVAPISQTGLETVTVVDGLLGDPLLVAAPSGDNDRIFIVEQDGFIRIHRRGDAPGVTSLFLDISGRIVRNGNEQGLLGLAFDPDYGTTGEFYVNYTAGSFGSFRTVVSRFAVSSDPDVADPLSEEQLLVFAQDAFATNHNGGQLLFGTDGFLYVFAGDGGGSNDNHGTCGNGQNTGTLLGKIARIDVRGVDPNATAPDCDPDGGYLVPSGNPLSDGLGGDCDEIYAYGVRNPWRSDIDPANGDFYVADVGQNCWEEINYLPAVDAPGANYGWRQMEGDHCFDPSNANNCNPSAVTCGSSPACNDPGLTDPLVEYGHANGCSVTGGFVYRGCRMPSLRGTYFYGDYCSAFINSFRVVAGVPTEQTDWTTQLDPGGQLVNGLTSFGKNGLGELFIVDRSGQVLKILPLFSDLIVSAPGASTPFLLGTSSWSWEDLSSSTEHPVDAYKVYRGVPNG
ncbi:MAG: PQQ-dependent sugar dehydrogenase, partial [Acidobacteriota bacterium]